ncbi:hypothetical protein ACSW9V_15190 (plasmid) [Clostridium perfringens]|uniref:hypothetical protein n=1 Tax=Clostridium perfringens TaxID=1502 RepID=UPI000B3978AE|nr:hypothetical protein [Clostridium perfringens]EGT0690042.1 hypothetical protein [Clostridium perfringens]EGT0693568.1 hypothetical protein [Clostridium perfringens]MDU3376227.1 hypothetical protein [Clostridium perfringens]MDU3534183.1 hypothetical protein [Clostridium perfringens]OUN51158.1 hypothetical protein B5G18_13390 [Clostridium perfringens]
MIVEEYKPKYILKNLQDIYTKEFLKDKYILIIDSKLYYNNIFNINMSMDFKVNPELVDHKQYDLNNILNINEIKDCGNIRIFSTETASVYSMNLFFRRKTFNYGIPLIFNSFEDLKQIKDIYIDWNIHIKSFDIKLRYKYKLEFFKMDNSKENIFILDANNIFISPPQYEYYHSLENPFELNKLSQEQQSNVKITREYIDSIDSILIGLIDAEGNMSYKYLKGNEEGAKLLKIANQKHYLGNLIDKNIKTSDLAMGYLMYRTLKENTINDKEFKLS